MRIVLAGVLIFYAQWIMASPLPGIQSRSLAGAVRGSVGGAEAIYYNPASIGLMKTFSAEGSYWKRLDSSENGFEFSLVDAKSGPLSAGLGYYYLISHHASLTLAAALVPKMLSLGATIRYVNTPPENSSETLHVFEGDAGALLILGPLGLGLTWRNWPIYGSGRKQVLGTGFSLSLAKLLLKKELQSEMNQGDEQSKWFGDLKFNADYEWTFIADGIPPQGILMAGITLDFFAGFSARGGYSYAKSSESQMLHCGLGYQGSFFGIDGLFEQDLVMQDHRLLGISLRLEY